jgi:hypothetical protein
MAGSKDGTVVEDAPEESGSEYASDAGASQDASDDSGPAARQIEMTPLDADAEGTVMSGGSGKTKWRISKDHIIVERTTGVAESILFSIVLGIVFGLIGYIAYSDPSVTDPKTQENNRMYTAIGVGCGMFLASLLFFLMALVKRVTDTMETKLVTDIAKSSSCPQTCCWSCSCANKGTIEIYSMDPRTPVVFLKCSNVHEVWDGLQEWADQVIEATQQELAGYASPLPALGKDDSDDEDDDAGPEFDNTILYDGEAGCCCKCCGCKDHVKVTNKLVETTSYGCTRRTDNIRMQRVYDMQMSKNCLNICCLPFCPCAGKGNITTWSFDRDGFECTIRIKEAQALFMDMRKNVKAMKASDVYGKQQKLMGVIYDHEN